jgi:putative transcriptional regulator
MTSQLAPGLLIAAPQLLDANFARAVILLLHHDESGSMGIVINRPLELPLTEVARQHGVEQCRATGAAHFGGPVEVYRGFVLHRGERFEDDTDVADGIMLSGSVDVLRALLERVGADFRLYLGYAGWGPGQLDLELTSGSWLTGECRASYLFDVDPDEVWEQALVDMGIDPALLLQSTGDIQ